MNKNIKNYFKKHPTILGLDYRYAVGALAATGVCLVVSYLLSFVPTIIEEPVGINVVTDGTGGSAGVDRRCIGEPTYTCKLKYLVNGKKRSMKRVCKSQCHNSKFSNKATHDQLPQTKPNKGQD